VNIQDKLFLGTYVSFIFGIIFVYLVIITSLEISEQNNDLQLALDIGNAISELDILTYEYLLHHETRMEEQWEKKYNSGAKILRNAAGAEELQQDYIDVGRIFLQVTKNYQKTQSLIQAEVSQDKIDTSLLLEERLVTNLLIASQSIISKSNSLSKKSFSEITKIQRIANSFVLSLMLILVVIISLSSLLIARSISKPLNILIDGTRIIGAGNLTHKVNVESEDEISELADFFNKMAVNLGKIDQVKTQFLAMTSHELKTPIVPIKLQLELLLQDKKGKLNQKQKQRVLMIQQNTNHLLRLIDDVLDISKMHAGKFTLLPEKNNLNDTIKLVLKNFNSEASKKKIKLIAKLSQINEIDFDQKRIYQVITNLVGNAVKFTQKGSIKISTIKKSKFILVKIQDTGIGIAKKDKMRIFDPFTQVKPSYQIKNKGTGLGLAISKNIIKVHGGEIAVNSTVNKGSTFYFTLPLNKIKHVKNKTKVIQTTAHKNKKKKK
jgi:signal transduction histidine kinase